MLNFLSNLGAYGHTLLAYDCKGVQFVHMNTSLRLIYSEQMFAIWTPLGFIPVFGRKALMKLERNYSILSLTFRDS